MKIALVENFGSDFYGARLRYALFLQRKGHEVIAIVPNDGFVEKIEKEGVKTISVNIDIRKRNLKSMLSFIRQLYMIFKNQKFDVVHLYRLQPNLLGTSVAYFANKKSKIINHITGLGVAFTNSGIRYKIIQLIIKGGYRINYKFFNALFIFQNFEDKKEFGNRKKYLVIKGSAVNEDKFNKSVVPKLNLKSKILGNIKNTNSLNLIFVSRLLKQKGLNYLVDSVIEYNSMYRDSPINLIVAGWIDSNNPNSFTEQDIEEFNKNQHIFFLGKRNDINELIAISDIAVLPTYYREGTPRFLLESMAMAKPIITTNMPGCNHLIKDSKNGILVEPKDKQQLLKAIETLLKQDLSLLGQNSKKIYEEEFSEKVVYGKVLKSYY